MTDPAGSTDSEAILLVAHGSRVAESNAEIETLAGRLAGTVMPGRTVAHAFLELAEPSIPDAIDALAGDGVGRIILIPYFLSAGRHVREDIPAIIRAAQARHRGLSVEMTAHFGAQDRVPELLAALVPDRTKS